MLVYPEAVTKREFHSVKGLLWECFCQAGVSWWLVLWGEGAGGGCRERSLILAQDVGPSPPCSPGGQERTDHTTAAESYELVSCFTGAACGCTNFPLLVVHLHVDLLSSSVWAVV